MERESYGRFVDLYGHFLREVLQKHEQPLVQLAASSLGRTFDKSLVLLWRPNPQGEGAQGARWRYAEDAEDAEILTAVVVQHYVEQIGEHLDQAQVRRDDGLVFQQTERDGQVVFFIVTAPPKP